MTKEVTTLRFILGGALACLLSSVIQTSVAHAGSCSPGIPCTTYTLSAQPTAGTNAAYNGPKTGQPSPYTGGSCDGNFMNQIIGQAYLGASREKIMSEQLIQKPDSVLAYTCFDQLLGQTAQHGGVFSETLTFGRNTGGNRRGFALKAGDDSDGTNPNDGSNESNGQITGSLIGVPPPQCTANNANEPCEEYWVVDSSGRFREMGTLVATGTFGSSTVQHDARLDNLLARTVTSSMYRYLNSNYNHTYLGGSSTINRTSAGGGYNCPEMGTIWQIAQCSDFGEYDRFRSFSDLVTQDPRAFPTGCSPANIANDSDDEIDSSNPPLLFSYSVSAPCPGTSTTGGANTGITNAHIDMANNCNYNYASFDVFNPHFKIVKSPINSASPASATKLLTGHPLIGTGSPPTGCSAPLPTGVTVMTYEHNLVSIGATLGLPVPTVPLVVLVYHNEHVCPNPGCHYLPAGKYPDTNPSYNIIPGISGSKLNLIDASSYKPSHSGWCVPL